MGLRTKVVEAIRRIRKTRRKLEVYIAKARAKEKELMNKLIEVQKEGDELRAKVYANEIARLRKFIADITALDVKLEQAELKLQSILTLGDVGFALKPVVNDIKTLMGPIKALLPDIEGEMEDLIEVIDDIAEEDTVGGTFVDVYLDSEAEKILKEAQILAQKRLEENLALVSGEGSKA